MFGNKRRLQPPTPPSQRIVLVRIPGMEQLVAAISDLTAAVTQLVTVEQQVVDALHNTTPDGTTKLSAADQAALDAAVTTVQSVASTLSAALPPAPAAPAPVAEPTPAPETAPASEPTATDTPTA